MSEGTPNDTATIAGFVAGGTPRFAPVRASGDNRVEIEFEGRLLHLKRDDVAVFVAGGDAAAVAARARATAATIDVAALAAALGAGEGAALSVGEWAARAGIAADAVAALWLALWDAPEWFARIGRARFRVRAPSEAAAERERLLHKRRVERLLHAIDDEAHRVHEGALAPEEWATVRVEVAATMRALAYGESPADQVEAEVLPRVEHHLQAWHDREHLAWPLSWHAAQWLGDRDPWRHGAPLLVAHQRWLRGHGDTAPPLKPLPPLATATPLVAVDDADTVERDDAVGVARVGVAEAVVEVAVADTTVGYAGDDDWLAAVADVATSVYLPTGTIPLLPPAWGYRRHSLDGGSERPVMLLRFRFDTRDGRLVAAPEIHRGVATIAAHTSYAAIDDGAAPQDWSTLAALAAQLHAARVAAGADVIEAPEAVVTVVGGHPQTLQTSQPWLGARAVVREWMVLANATFADMLAARRLPAPYRIQEGGPRDRTPVRVMLDSAPHRGLGVARYTYATSPLRRVADALTQRQLLALWGGAPLPRAHLQPLTDRVERGYLEMRRWMAAAQTYWKLRYLEAFPATALMGTPLVMAAAGEFVKVQIDPLALVRLLPHPGVPLGGARPLALVHVDAERGALELRWS